MRRFAYLGLLLGFLPSTTLAQTTCEAVRPASIPACMVGAWYGGSDASEKFQSILNSIPSAEMRARVSGSMGQYLAIGIYPDGYYATWPVDGSLDGEFRSDNGSMTFGMDLKIDPTLGWMSVDDGGQLSFCAVSGSGGVLSLQTQGLHGETRKFMPIEPLPGGPTPRIDVLCDGNTLQMLVHLPAPIGIVTYTLDRVPASRMSEDLRGLYDRRFAHE